MIPNWYHAPYKLPIIQHREWMNNVPLDVIEYPRSKVKLQQDIPQLVIETPLVKVTQTNIPPHLHYISNFFISHDNTFHQLIASTYGSLKDLTSSCDYVISQNNKTIDNGVTQFQHIHFISPHMMPKSMESQRCYKPSYTSTNKTESHQL